MANLNLSSEFNDLSTPLLADACLRVGVALRVSPPGLTPLAGGSRAVGPVRPAVHVGSVDVFLEAIDRSDPGEVLVVDNAGRRDEGCIGDLIVLEARAAGLAGVVVWGAHRDSEELLSIGFPVFSYGTCPLGPRRLEPRTPGALEEAQFGNDLVTTADLVFADADGAVFLPKEAGEEVLAAAREIREAERRQADRVLAGESLRVQLQLDRYLQRKADDPDFSFRRHLRELGGEIEE